MGGMENNFSLGSVLFHVLTMVNFVVVFNFFSYFLFLCISWERHGKPSSPCLLQVRNVGLDPCKNGYSRISLRR
jgi:hypothetical protein